MSEKTGLDRYTVTVPWWKFWAKCPKCKGGKWIESQTVLIGGVQKIYTCLGCGYPKKR